MFESLRFESLRSDSWQAIRRLCREPGFAAIMLIALAEAAWYR